MVLTFTEPIYTTAVLFYWVFLWRSPVESCVMQYITVWNAVYLSVTGICESLQSFNSVLFIYFFKTEIITSHSSFTSV